MKYSTAQAFRQALEDRLRSVNSPHKLPRLRKMIAFERFMARLDDRWILKGGYALQLRTEKARTTQDVDLLAQEVAEDQIAETLLEALHRDAADYFEFFVERSHLLASQYRRFAKDLGLPFTDFDEAIQATQEFLSPVLQGLDNGFWNSEDWEWQS